MITEKNYKETRTGLKLYLAKEIGLYIHRAGSMEKLSLLLNRSITYVRIIFDRNPSIEKLEGLLEECRRKIKN
jgi:hypothetical protein